MAYFHPTLVSEKLVETVNFYEDFFGFVPSIEKDGYTLLQNRIDPNICIAVFDKNHKCAKDLEKVQGLIINVPVKNLKVVYDDLYMEGLAIYKDLSEDIHGNKHFVVSDPNGVLVNILQPHKSEQLIDA